jgi:hypothetical protein
MMTSILCLGVVPRFFDTATIWLRLNETTPPAPGFCSSLSGVVNEVYFSRRLCEEFYSSTRGLGGSGIDSFLMGGFANFS